MPDVLPVKHVAVVRTMQDSLGTVQHDPKSRAREGFDRGTEMMDQGLLACGNLRSRHFLHRCGFLFLEHHQKERTERDSQEQWG